MNREEDIIKWAQERHIFDSATPAGQHGKTFEEVQELTDALAANDKAEIKDAIGDIVVTLILQAHMHGWPLEECVEAAYQEIKDRKGRMVDGVFVKEGGVNRDELLIKLAMELSRWPRRSDGDAIYRNSASEVPEITAVVVCESGGPIEVDALGYSFSEREWLQRRAELINKPSWDEAPEWAEYLTQDRNGTWVWWEFEPERDSEEWFEPEHANGCILVLASKSACPAGHDWRQTLERRPTESKESSVIYAIHRRTKEHRIVPRLDVLSSYDWRYAVADADGWIPWEGGECPLPKNRGFDAITRDSGVHEECNLWRWNHAGLSSDLIAYRPILDEPSETEALAWNGEGLPLEGIECEVELESGCFEWCQINAHRGSSSWITTKTEDRVVRNDLVFFRPIRSEEDRAVEAMLALDDYDTESYNSGMMSRDDFCRALYRAGYRKQEVGNGV